jgi:diguanylate cyclase (GGDEF)-like protein
MGAMEGRAEGRIRVVIADDTEDVRSLLRYTLELDGRFEVVGQAADGVEAIAACEAEQPDVAVVDLAMPVMDGLTAIPSINHAAPATQVVVLSSFGARQMAAKALAAGAAAFVEKATFQTLTDVLVDVCRRRPAEAPRPTAAADAAERADNTDPVATTTATTTTMAGTTATAPTIAPTTDPAELDAGSAGPPPAASTDADARRLSAVVRDARWVAVAFALLQFLLYRPPTGVHMPFPRVPVGLVVAGVLAAVNLATTRKPRPRLALAVDAAVVLTVIWLFSFEGSTALWTLLIVPVIEGALVAELPGALSVWALSGAGYVLREHWASAHYGLHKIDPESLTYSLGVVLLVAMTTGHLVRSFNRTSAEHARARAESERRAELLGLVVQASRSLAALDSAELLSAVVEATASLGFDGVELCVADEAGRWRVEERRGVDLEGPATDGTLPEAARLRRDSVLVAAALVDAALVDAAGPVGTMGAPWFEAGYETVVATPIRSGDAVLAALVAARRDGSPVGAPEVECVELLAAQAGVALANARLLERVRHQALHDALTGLPNQTLFEDRVNQALTGAGRTRTRAALLFVDLDRFKKVNDTLGHDFGNELLRQVAGRLLGVIRTGDTVARMGGDEFALLLPSLNRDRDAGIVAGKVLDALRSPFSIGGHQLFVNASVGISVYPADGMRYETLLKHADIAMYRAKASGGNAFELYGARTVEEHAYPRLALEADLHHALPRDELRVVYQPMLDLTDGEVRAVEALVRWRHPELGDIQPDEFLPLAEEAGLLGTIDSWVLETACTRAVGWLRARALANGGARGKTPSLRLAVNVSPRQLQHPRFADTVLATLARTGLSPSVLELEVTEGSAVADAVEARASLARLRAAGVRVAIDDFGTGYSMLSRLQDFPLDTLKIDRSFISEIRDPGDAAPIVSATIAMARSLGLAVVAEGVEHDAQVGFLREAGCDLAQGFLFSEPVEADAVINLIDEGVKTG